MAMKYVQFDFKNTKIITISITVFLVGTRIVAILGSLTRYCFLI